MERAGIHSRWMKSLSGRRNEKLKPFPEVPEALARLQKKYRLVYFSNAIPICSRRQAYHKVSLRQGDIRAAEANSFKPQCGDLCQGRGASRPKADQILFVANHAFDCIGAKSAGHATAFIDRRSRPWHHAFINRTSSFPSMNISGDAIV